MSLPAEVAQSLHRQTGRRVLAARVVAGGDINEAYEVRLDGDARVFVKTRRDAHPGEFAGEAAGLQWLAQTGALAVPRVIAMAGDYLALEWIQTGELQRAGQEQLGRGLAELHAARAATFGQLPPRVPPAQGEARSPFFFIGRLRLPSGVEPQWSTFYAVQRLQPLLALARDNGSLSAAGARAVERVCERIEELAGPPEPPARLHGDLWSGNVLAGADGRPYLIDPAAYGGHREVDLAMLALFGAPGLERVIAAYDEAYPLAAGHRERVKLWQLFPLLVHAVLFGGSYGAAAAACATVCAR